MVGGLRVWGQTATLSKILFRKLIISDPGAPRSEGRPRDGEHEETERGFECRHQIARVELTVTAPVSMWWPDTSALSAQTDLDGFLILASLAAVFIGVLRNNLHDVPLVKYFCSDNALARPSPFVAAHRTCLVFRFARTADSMFSVFLGNRIVARFLPAATGNVDLLARSLCRPTPSRTALDWFLWLALLFACPAFRRAPNSPIRNPNSPTRCNRAQAAIISSPAWPPSTARIGSAPPPPRPFRGAEASLRRSILRPFPTPTGPTAALPSSASPTPTVIR